MKKNYTTKRIVACRTRKTIFCLYRCISHTWLASSECLISLESLENTHRFFFYLEFSLLYYCTLSPHTNLERRREKLQKIFNFQARAKKSSKKVLVHAIGSEGNSILKRFRFFFAWRHLKSLKNLLNDREGAEFW